MLGTQSILRATEQFTIPDSSGLPSHLSYYKKHIVTKC